MRELLKLASRVDPSTSCGLGYSRLWDNTWCAFQICFLLVDFEPKWYLGIFCSTLFVMSRIFLVLTVFIILVILIFILWYIYFKCNGIFYFISIIIKKWKKIVNDCVSIENIALCGFINFFIKLLNKLDDTPHIMPLYMITHYIA